MDVNKLIIGMPYVYRAKNGKDMVVTFTDQPTTGAMYFTPEDGNIGSCLGRIR